MVKRTGTLQGRPWEGGLFGPLAVAWRIQMLGGEGGCKYLTLQVGSCFRNMDLQRGAEGSHFAYQLLDLCLSIMDAFLSFIWDFVSLDTTCSKILNEHNCRMEVSPDNCFTISEN